MDSRYGICSLAAATGSVAAAVLAGAVAADDGAPTLQQMAERLRALETANEGLRQEVRDLRGQQGEQWLSSERAAQVRGIVHDVLADAETRASLAGSGVTAGYADGFFIASPDGSNSLKANMLLQSRLVFSLLPRGSSRTTSFNWPNNPDVKETRWGFDIPNAQLTLSGRLFDSRVEYMVRGGFTNDSSTLYDAQRQGPNPFSQGAFQGQWMGISGSGSGRLALLDAWMRFNLDEEWSVRTGQFKLPFDREFLVYDAFLLSAGRSVLSDRFSPGYSQGVELEYRGDSLGWKLAFSDGGTDNLAGPYLSLVGTDPLNSVWYQEQANWALTSRIEFKLAGLWSDFREMTSPQGEEYGLLVGGAVSYQQGRNWYSQDRILGTGDQYNNWLNVTADVTANFGGASLFASFYYSYVQSGAAQAYYANFLQGLGAQQAFDAGNVSAFGFLVQGSLYLDRDWEVFGRFEFGSASGPSGLTGLNAGFNNPSDLYLLTLGWNYYMKGQNSRWTTDFGIALQPVGYFWATPEAGLRASGNSGQLVIRSQWQIFF